MKTQANRGLISIWFFVGAILLVYGALIFATGIYELFHPPEKPVVLAHLHASIWWGALLLILGAFYFWRFAPGRKR
jgi:hypothetical protein